MLEEGRALGAAADHPAEIQIVHRPHNFMSNAPTPFGFEKPSIGVIFLVPLSDDIPCWAVRIALHENLPNKYIMMRYNAIMLLEETRSVV